MTAMMDVVVTSLEQQIRTALSRNDLEALRALLTQQHSSDVADALGRLDADDQVKAFELLSDQQAANVLHDLGSITTRQVFSQLRTDRIGHILDLMPMDDAAWVLSNSVPERREELLTAMGAADAKEVRSLLSFPKESAGRLMTEKFASVKPEMTVIEAIQHLRHVDPEVETLTDVYVLDVQQQLIGVLSLRELMRAENESIIQDIMTKPVISVSADTDQEDVARLASRYDFLAVPVTDASKRLLGLITVDDILHVLVEESTEDQLRFAAVEGGVINQPYFSVPLWQVIRSRIGWLLLLFVAETLTGTVLRAFESELAAVVALSFFIPLLIGTGGNTGAQTVSTIIRGLALKEIVPRDLWRVVLRELRSGLIIGLLLGTVAFFRTTLWGGLDLKFCLVIGLTILAVCTWANTIGALIPMLAQRLKIDPAVVSAPLITTLVDATGLFIYLTIAKLILDAI